MTNTANTEASDKPREAGSKKPYQAPAFRFERVFEVSALSCGKMAGTEGQCTSNSKNS